MKNQVLTGRTRPLQTCGCGCGITVSWHRLRRIPAINHEPYYVREECHEVFMSELDAFTQFSQLVRILRGTSCYRRWRYARYFFQLQIIMHARKMGLRRARAHAWRGLWRFVLPAWMTCMVAEIKANKI